MNEYRSTPGQVKDFIVSPVWQDMLVELGGAVHQMRNGLELAKDFEAVLRYQECIETLRRVIEMPEVILSDMEALKPQGAANAEDESYKEEF